MIRALFAVDNLFCWISGSGFLPILVDSSASVPSDGSGWIQKRRNRLICQSCFSLIEDVTESANPSSFLLFLLLLFLLLLFLLLFLLLLFLLLFLLRFLLFPAFPLYPSLSLLKTVRGRRAKGREGKVRWSGGVGGGGERKQWKYRPEIQLLITSETFKENKQTTRQANKRNETKNE